MSIISRLAKLEPRTFHVFKTTAVDYWFGWSSLEEHYERLFQDDCLDDPEELLGRGVLKFKMQLTKIALAQYVMNELNEELRGGLSTDSEIYFSAAPFSDKDNDTRGHLMYAVKCDNNGDVIHFLPVHDFVSYEKGNPLEGTAAYITTTSLEVM